MNPKELKRPSEDEAQDQAEDGQSAEEAPVSADEIPVEYEVLPPETPLSKEGAQDHEKESSGTEVVPYDPLRAYLREMRRYPQLTREEERDLAIQYREHQDLEAAYKLVTSNLWLVVKIARDYERAARSLLDLIQEGNMGLMEAVKNFDPYRGVRFPSYAVWWIKAYIVRYLIANWRIVKLGTTQAQRKLFFNLNKEKEKLEREGFYPAPKLLAEKLNVKESEVIEMDQRLAGPDVSVDAPLMADTDTPLLGVLPADQLTSEDQLAQKELWSMLSQGLEEFGTTLNAKERLIFDQRLLGEEKATLQDLSEKLSISKERVRQLENRVKDKLKKFMLDKFGSAIENIEF